MKTTVEGDGATNPSSVNLDITSMVGGKPDLQTVVVQNLSRKERRLPPQSVAKSLAINCRRHFDERWGFKR